MSDPLAPIVAGPYPYFSAPNIWYGRCPREDYDTGKVMSPREAEKRTWAHINGKHAEEVREVIDDLVDAWHSGAGSGVDLREFLGMKRREYDVWARTGKIPEFWQPPRLAS